MFSSDVIVIGGGLVGTAVAYGLGQLGKNITVFDPVQANPPRRWHRPLRATLPTADKTAVMLARLGPNVWHDTPPAAFGTTP